MTARSNMNFLIVDDQLTMRRLIKSCLRQLDFVNFHEAENVNMALNLLKNQPIDFVILDWNMPNRPGIDLLKEIRSSDNFKDLPVLMVTSEAEQEMIMEAIKAKVSGYIIKPVNTKIMAEKINAILGI
ncbi:MAG: response regulator [Proteobacteria bacterium]|nr:response regulator [Pseudomonadota bacterium]